MVRHIFKKINSIFVETSSMKEQLESQGYNNIDVIPNCKELVILDAKTIKYTDTKPYRLCTFSRVTKEKGIEDAVQAVCEINSMHNDVFAELDVYGQIEDNQKEWFEKLQTLAPQYIRYKGMVPFTQSTKVWGQMGTGYLRSLFALGFQGFLILICVAIYAVLVQSIPSSGDVHGAIWGTAGYTVLLAFALFKTGSYPNPYLMQDSMNKTNSKKEDFIYE